MQGLDPEQKRELQPPTMDVLEDEEKDPQRQIREGRSVRERMILSKSIPWSYARGFPHSLNLTPIQYRNSLTFFPFKELECCQGAKGRVPQSIFLSFKGFKTPLYTTFPIEVEKRNSRRTLWRKTAPRKHASFSRSETHLSGLSRLAFGYKEGNLLDEGIAYERGQIDYFSYYLRSLSFDFSYQASSQKQEAQERAVRARAVRKAVG